MQQLIASYLLAEKYCPLPGIGSLQFVQQSAQYVSGDNSITAPKTAIRLLPDALSHKDLVSFLAARQQISNWQAESDLEAFCKDIKELSGSQEIELPYAGKFFVDEEGYLSFKSQSIFTAFFADVPAHRVVHPNEQHQILVGDQEKTNTEMTEILSGKSDPAASKWWIAALVFLVIAGAIIAYYYSTAQPLNTGGNGTSISVEKAEATYRVPK